MRLPTDRPYLFLFLLVCGCSMIGSTVGWVIGIVAGLNDRSVGVIFGGVLGGIIGTLISERWKLITEWDRMLVYLPATGFFIFGGIAYGYSLPDVITVLCGVFGSGFGGMTVKYIMEFFDEDPPTSIF